MRQEGDLAMTSVKEFEEQEAQRFTSMIGQIEQEIEGLKNQIQEKKNLIKKYKKSLKDLTGNQS
jgi:hypothetical protein